MGGGEGVGAGGKRRNKKEERQKRDSYWTTHNETFGLTERDKYVDVCRCGEETSPEVTVRRNSNRI